jgi:23S rRNA (guanosine2251-2'-O)-methyltransferase
MIFYGLHACLAALRNPKRGVERIYLADKKNIGQIPEEHHKKIHIVDHIPAPSGSVHQGIAVHLDPLPLTDTSTLEDAKRVVVLDHVTDPQNVGAILRTSAVFKVQGLILTDRHSPRESPAMAKAASGALEHVPLFFVTNLTRALEELKEMGLWTIALMESAEKPLHSCDLTGRIALVLGGEGQGLRPLTQRTCDMRAYLPGAFGFSTLNVSHAAAVSLYEMERQATKT